MWWAGNFSLTESLPELIQEVRQDLAGPWEASLNGKQVENYSFPRVSTLHSPPLAITVIKRKSKVLTAGTVVH